MKTDPNLFILACHGLLGLKKPVEIRIATTDFSRCKGAAAIYEARERKGKVIRHMVHINLHALIESEYRMVDVIAHEMCHAAQVEYGIFNDDYHHDAKFQGLCKYLKGECKKLGFVLGKLYNPETDTD